MTKLIFAACFSLTAVALSTASYAGEQDRQTGASVDPMQHVIRAGIMSGLRGTNLTPAPQLAAGDPERNVISAGLRSGLPGSQIPADQRFHVRGADDPVRSVLSAGIMAARPDDFAPAR